MPRPISQYRHVQSVAATTWTVTHGLKTYPVCDVYVSVSGVVQKVLPASVVYVDQDTVTITFSSATAGFATITG